MRAAPPVDMDLWFVPHTEVRPTDEIISDPATIEERDPTMADLLRRKLAQAKGRPLVYVLVRRKLWPTAA